MLATFCQSEDGAITVDWTVLTGTLVGLGLAAAACCRQRGVVACRRISRTCSAASWRRPAEALYFSGFDLGAPGWVNGVVSNDSGFGSLLGPYGGTNGEQAVHSAFDIPDGTDLASFTFDMVAIDSWGQRSNSSSLSTAPTAASLRFHYGTDGVTGEWSATTPTTRSRCSKTGPRDTAATMPTGLTRRRRCSWTSGTPGRQ